MAKTLDELLEQYRGKLPTLEQMEQKLKSFAYGNLAVDGLPVSRSATDAAVDRLLSSGNAAKNRKKRQRKGNPHV